MKEIKNKKTLIVMVAVLALAAVGGTIAYYADKMFFTNRFTAASFIMDYIETFDSPDNWSPCEETPKTIVATNRSNGPVSVRVKLSESWKGQNNENLPLTVNIDGQDSRIAIINLDNTDKWTFDGEYYNYYRDLQPGETTESLMKSVTFNCNVNFVKEEITYVETETGTIGTSSENEYLRSKYHLTANIQANQK
ncbi:MAG: BsaA family SipW-dependent biofilm matrix protein [Candidatus Saccharibacteria bacterium]|nr:BsaA family SipW-dependent biofilm matrix protein [Candidatus Saccharibacteria bacterium]